MISNLRDIAANPPCGWSVKRRLSYVRWAQEVADELKGVSRRLRMSLNGRQGTLRPRSPPVSTYRTDRVDCVTSTAVSVLVPCPIGAALPNGFDPAHPRPDAFAKVPVHRSTINEKGRWSGEDLAPYAISPRVGKTSERDFESVASTYIILPSAANASQSRCSAMPRAPASHTMDPLQARRSAASHMVHRTSSPFPPSRYLWICLHCKTRRRPASRKLCLREQRCSGSVTMIEFLRPSGRHDAVCQRVATSIATPRSSLCVTGPYRQTGAISQA